MLTISLVTVIFTYCLAKTILDICFGQVPPDDYLNKYYKTVRGEETKKTKKIVISPNKFHGDNINGKKYQQYALVAAVMTFLFCIVVLKNIIFAMILSVTALLYPPHMMKAKKKKRKDLLNVQMREAMQSISNSLKAGSSLQVAVERCLEDMKRILKTQVDKPIVDELEVMIYEMQVGKTLDEALIGFKNRVQLEDVDTFVNAALITKEKGGNLTEVMANVAESISDKIQIKREIMTLTAGKRSEAKLLTIMPLCLVVGLTFLSPTYMKPMYETNLGRTMMTVGVIFVAANYIIGKKIINIDI